MPKFRDLTDLTFNRLTVKSLSSKRGNRNQIYWNCVCACGKEVIARGAAITQGRVASCGCKKVDLYNLVGQTFSKLTVLKKLNKQYYSGEYYYLCRCECGNMVESIGSPLKNGMKKSCGCMPKASFGEKASSWTGCGLISGSHWARIVLEAKRRRIEVNITPEEAWQKFLEQEGKCALSGIELTFKVRTKDRGCTVTASLDRIDSKRGYKNDNIQWVHKYINVMKSNHDQDYFIELCRKVVSHNGN